jgi:glycosyltransferase involved in cell wall biosynthesis
MGALTGFHPFIVTVHGSEVHLTKGIKKWLVAWVLKKADLVTADARHTINRISKITRGKAKDKSIMVRFGVDVNRFKSDHKNPTEKAVISLRNHEPVYDLMTLIKAIPIVLETAPDVRFWIAGHGSMTDELKDAVKKLGVENSVIFSVVHGQDGVASALNRAIIYVSTALSDAGLASSTAEAMACELPVIVSNVAENRVWACGRGKCKQVFEPGNHEELAGKIIYFLEHAVVRRQYGERNRKVIVSLNNYDREMQVMEHFYKEVSNG